MNYKVWGNTMKNLLKKKVVMIPTVIIIYIILFSKFTELVGALTLIGGIGGGVYLFTKNENFKSKHIVIKTLTGITIFCVVIIFGIGGLFKGIIGIFKRKSKKDKEANLYSEEIVLIDNPEVEK